VRRPGIAYGNRMVGTAPVRGVCPEYGDMRNEQPSEGRWINSLDQLERRRVVFLGARVREQLFGGRPAVGETVLIAGVRFTVIGTMDRKIQLSNYFSSDDESTWIPYSAANDLWNAKYGSVLVFEPIAPQFEQRAEAQVLAAIATRQQFSPTDKKAIQMFGREEFRPVINGITIGLQVLLIFIGILTLGIGGVGVMNIMLVSVTERTREIGVRKALGATKRDILWQFLTEAMTLTGAGGVIGILIGAVAAFLINTFSPFPAVIQPTWVLIAFSTSMIVGLTFGMWPAAKAARLDPIEALRYE
jgi:putative ABC transport system permease protein